MGIDELINKWQEESDGLTKLIESTHDNIELSQILAVRNRINIAIIELQNLRDGFV